MNVHIKNYLFELLLFEQRSMCSKTVQLKNQNQMTR